MVIILATETKSFTTDAFYSSNCKIVTLNAIIAIGARATLVRFTGVCKKLADLLLIFVENFGITRELGAIQYLFNRFI